MKATKTAQTQAGDWSTDANSLDFAGEAMLADMTRKQVAAQLVSRIRGEQGYFAYRKACNRRTNYDDQVLADTRALALAAVLLDDQGPAQPPEVSGSSRTSGISRAASS